MSHLKIASFFLAVSSFASGIFILLKGLKLKKKDIFIWALFNFSIFLYSLGTYFSEVPASDIYSSYIWWKIAYVGIIFIPTFYYHFTVLMLSTYEKRKLLVWAFYINSFIFQSGNLFGTWFFDIDDVRYVLDSFFVIDAHPLFVAFFTMWVLQVVLSIIEMFLKYPHVLGVKKQQIKYHLLGGVIGYTGGLTHFITIFRIDIYPYGVYLVSIYIILTSYSIIRYRFLEIDTVIHKTLLWIVSISLLIIPAGFLQSIILRKWLVNLDNTIVVIFISSFTLMVIWYYNFLRPRIDLFFRRRKYDYQTILGKVAEKIAASINLEELTRQLLIEVCEAMYLRNGLLYILNEKKRGYYLQGRYGYKDVRQRAEIEMYTQEEIISIRNDEANTCLQEFEEFNPEHPLCFWLVEQREVIERGQVEENPKYEDMKKEAIAWFESRDLEVIIPVVYEDKMVAVLGLGKKESLQSYTVKDIDLLKKLGEEVGLVVFNSLHHEDVVKKERLEEEMRLGRQIQIELLPQASPQIQSLTIEGLMQPAREIGGDYYDFIDYSPQKIGIVVADVSGKGLGSGMVMSMTKSAIYSLAEQNLSPRGVVVGLNRLLCKQLHQQKFISLIYAEYDSNDNIFTWAGAGHEHIIVRRESGVEVLKTGGIVLGMIEDIGHMITQDSITLNKEDKIILYTDGVTEARNSQREMFTLNRLVGTVKNYGNLPAKELLSSITEEVQRFIGDTPQYDDITLVVLGKE